MNFSNLYQLQVHVHKKKITPKKELINLEQGVTYLSVALKKLKNQLKKDQIELYQLNMYLPQRWYNF